MTYLDASIVSEVINGPGSTPVETKAAATTTAATKRVRNEIRNIFSVRSFGSV